MGIAHEAVIPLILILFDSDVVLSYSPLLC